MNPESVDAAFSKVQKLELFGTFFFTNRIFVDAQNGRQQNSGFKKRGRIFVDAQKRPSTKFRPIFLKPEFC